jgi:hypothetical protein
VIYVNSISVEQTKFIDYVSALSRGVEDPVSAATSVYGLRNIIRGTGPVPGLTPTTSTTATTPGP